MAYLYPIVMICVFQIATTATSGIHSIRKCTGEFSAFWMRSRIARVRPRPPADKPRPQPTPPESAFEAGLRFETGSVL